MDERPRCLIVEDQALIAMSIEAYLDEMGYEAAGLFRSGTDALTWVRSHTPHAAILDYSLSDGACTALAKELRRRSIPFMVYSGHPRSAVAADTFRDVPWIEKPCTRDDLVSALQTLLVSRRQA